MEKFRNTSNSRLSSLGNRELYNKKPNIKLKEGTKLSLKGQSSRSKSTPLNLGQNLQSSSLKSKSFTQRKSEEKSKEISRLKLKKRLKVFKKEKKLFINLPAAYELGFISSARRVLINDNNLFELSPSDLIKIQNDETINIEFVDFTGPIRNSEYAFDYSDGKGDLTSCLENLNNSGWYNIGVHGINDNGTVEDKKASALSISKDGLNINNNSKTILSTAISLGEIKDVDNISDNIYNYNFGNNSQFNIVIAAPTYIENKNGDKLFLGFPEKNKNTAGQQYCEHCILDQICSDLKRIPPEFILGYLYEDIDGSKHFVENFKHFSNLPQEEKDVLFDELSSHMDDISNSYNNLIINKNIEKLNELKDLSKASNLPTFFADNALNLAEKYKERSLTSYNSHKKVLLDAKDNSKDDRDNEEVL